VTTDKSATEPSFSKAKNRRSDRYPVVVPVRVTWLEVAAQASSSCGAKEVNMHGGLLDMKGRPAINSVIELTNLSRLNSLRASGIPACLPKGRGVGIVAIELLLPANHFGA